MKKQAHARPDRRPGHTAVRARALELERTHGIPRQMAFQVAMGRVDLNAVLEKMALRDRVNGLMRRYELNKSLATQIALGQADLDHALRRMRMQAHLAEHGRRSVLEEAARSGEPMALGLHGLRMVTGRVTGVDRYEFRFVPDDGDEQTIHKLQVKYATDPRSARKVRNRLGTRPALHHPAEPIPRPQDRYTCSDLRLFGYLDSERMVAVVTLEGEVISGQVEWMARWEFGMKLKGGLHVVVFRHAVADIEES